MSETPCLNPVGLKKVEDFFFLFIIFQIKCTLRFIKSSQPHYIQTSKSNDYVVDALVSNLRDDSSDNSSNEGK